MSKSEDEWQLGWQEKYLANAKLFWRVWRQPRESWDHDHCSFCNAKFMDRADATDVLREGYATEDDYYWVCEACAHYFAERLKFTLIGGPGEAG